MKEYKTSEAKRRASENYRIKNKDKYNDYYKKYREKNGQKSYYKVYKNRVEMMMDKLYCWGEILDPEFQQEMLKIARGECDEQ